MSTEEFFDFIYNFKHGHSLECPFLLGESSSISDCKCGPVVEPEPEPEPQSGEDLPDWLK